MFNAEGQSSRGDFPTFEIYAETSFSVSSEILLSHNRDAIRSWSFFRTPATRAVVLFLCSPLARDFTSLDEINLPANHTCNFRGFGILGTVSPLCEIKANFRLKMENRTLSGALNLLCQKNSSFSQYVRLNSKPPPSFEKTIVIALKQQNLDVLEVRSLDYSWIWILSASNPFGRLVIRNPLAMVAFCLTRISQILLLHLLHRFTPLLTGSAVLVLKLSVNSCDYCWFICSSSAQNHPRCRGHSWCYPCNIHNFSFRRSI